MKEWRPNKGAQESFHKSGAFEVLYGGAAGGGKSESLIMEAARQIGNPTYKAILFRRTFPELETSLIIRAYQRYPFLNGKDSNGGKLWTFPSGATIRFSHLEHDSDVYKHQSAEYDYIGFDELTSFTEFQFLYMFSRCRGTDKAVKRYIRAATNPDNIGHVWVRQRFIDGKVPKQVYSEGNMTRCYIPATVYDNPVLLEGDPLYIDRLKMLPDAERRALLDGDWYVFEGQFFSEWRTEHHVVQPFEIPEGWQRYRSIDYGRTNPFCCKWYAVDYDGNVWVYREYYMANLTAAENALNIVDLSGKEKYQYTVADPAIFSKTHIAETIADVMARNGVVCIPAKNSRVSGWNSFREYLKWDDNHEPRIHYFKTCIDSIRTIPQMIHDKHNPEDLDTKGEDHCFVGDTLVDTASGQKKIKDLVGQEVYVNTMQGFKKSRSVRKTRIADVFEALFSDGRIVIATGDHRFLTTSGYKHLTDIELGYDELIQSGICIKSYPRLFKSLTKNATIYAANTFKEKVNACMSAFGENTMEKYRKATISTIKIMTEAITQSTILSLEQPLSISHTMHEHRKPVSDQKFQSNAQDRTQLHGTSQQKADNGIAPLLQKTQKRGQGLQKFAQFVKKITRLLSALLKNQSTAIKIVKLQHCGSEEVYDLTVPEAGHFTINGGIVVHNCADVDRYFIATLRERHPILETPEVRMIKNFIKKTEEKSGGLSTDFYANSVS